MTLTSKSSGNFGGVTGLSEPVLRALKSLNFKQPTPIQRKAIPVILSGQDVLAMSRTGSGKTAAFLLPLITRLDSHSSTVGIRGVVLSPTRELAMQIAKVAKQILKYTDLRLSLIVGGQSMESQFAKLSSNPDLVIATPGRLLHHLKEKSISSLSRLEMVVFDEADRMWEMSGMDDECMQILAFLNATGSADSAADCASVCSILLFSATLPDRITRAVGKFMKNPVLLKLDSESSIPDTLEFHTILCRPSQKLPALVSLVKSLPRTGKQEEVGAGARGIVFVATRHHVEFLTALLSSMQVKSSGIYGSMEQELRESEMRKFVNRQSQVLVATDLGARGLDIPNGGVDYCLNFDFPCSSPKLFIHRCGRTARNGRQGLAVSLVTTDELPYLFEVSAFIGREFEIKGLDRVDLNEEEVDKHVELFAQLKQSMEFAYIPYHKSRPSATKAALAKAKVIVRSFAEFAQNVTPLLAKAADTAATDVDAQSILKKLREFRPTGEQTFLNPETADKFNRRVVQNAILRRDVRAVFAKRQQPDSSDEDQQAEAEAPAAEEQRGGARKKRKQSVSMDKSVSIFDQTSCRSSQFFLGQSASKTQGGENFDLTGLDLSLSGGRSGTGGVVFDDDSKKKSQTVRRWDNKKKKFVLVDIGADGRKLKQKRNEAGKVISGKKTAPSMYAQWKKRTQGRVQGVGEAEDAKAIAPKRQDWPGAKAPPSSTEPADSRSSGLCSNSKYHGSLDSKDLTNKQRRVFKKQSDAGRGRVTSRGDRDAKAGELKDVREIAKNRKTHETKKMLQNPKTRKSFAKQSKDKFLEKKRAQWQDRSRGNARSRVVTRK